MATATDIERQKRARRKPLNASAAKPRDFGGGADRSSDHTRQIFRALRLGKVDGFP
jgi:hypothetical protein